MKTHYQEIITTNPDGSKVEQYFCWKTGELIKTLSYNSAGKLTQAKVGFEEVNYGDADHDEIFASESGNGAFAV